MYSTLYTFTTTTFIQLLDFISVVLEICELKISVFYFGEKPIVRGFRLSAFSLKSKIYYALSSTEANR